MSQSPRTILLIDDSLVDRMLYRRLLRGDSRYPFDFLEADTGEDGLALFRRHSPNLIFLDYRLPDMDGLEFIDFYRLQHPLSGDRLPIFLITGQEDKEIADSALKAGVLEYLDKGELTRESLIRSVHSALEVFDRVHFC